MKTSQAPERSRDKPVAKWERVSAASVGCCLGLALLKFGNPIVFFDRISLPTDALQVLFDPWPLLWAYFLFGAVFILAAIGLRRPFGTPAWILWLPLIWITIQLATTFTSVDRPLSGRTFLHLATVAGAFYLGLAVIGRFPDQRLVWGPILTAFAIVLIDGLYQHFYGLEETRRYFFAYEAPRYPNGPPPELLQKVASNRIYSTLFYPNTFAGTILLFAPLLLERISHVRATNAARRALLIMAAVLTGTCLIWSGSKAGWLIALGMAAFYVFRLPMTTRTRVILVAAICIVGAGTFAWRYAAYLKRGATSASARMDYWQAGFEAFRQRPLTGYGPGTFMLSYKRFKRPEAEMTRLAHNDYLQQASDSGLLAFGAFTLWIGGSLVWLYRKRLMDSRIFAVWLGVFGVAIHSLFEFHLYVPAVAWSEFLFLGWLCSQATRGQTPSTKPSASL